MNIQDLIYFEENPLHEGAYRVRPLDALCEVTLSGFCSVILYFIRQYQLLDDFFKELYFIDT